MTVVTEVTVVTVATVVTVVTVMTVLTVVTKYLSTQKKYNLPKTYLPTYLCDGSYCRDRSDSSDSSDSSDQKTFFTKEMFGPETFFFIKKKPFSHQKSRNLFTQKFTQPLYTQNIARIAKRCPSNVASVVNVSSCFYLKMSLLLPSLLSLLLLSLLLPSLLLLSLLLLSL